MNRASAVVHAFGIAPNYLVTLAVVGRRSGRVVSFPLVMAVVDGERYLVSMLGSDVAGFGIFEQPMAMLASVTDAPNECGSKRFQSRSARVRGDRRTGPGVPRSCDESGRIGKLENASRERKRSHPHHYSRSAVRGRSSA